MPPWSTSKQSSLGFRAGQATRGYLAGEQLFRRPSPWDRLLVGLSAVEEPVWARALFWPRRRDPKERSRSCGRLS